MYYTTLFYRVNIVVCLTAVWEYDDILVILINDILIININIIVKY
jgi:hypothetical protein